jgi:hypothetical protein
MMALRAKRWKERDTRERDTRERDTGRRDTAGVEFDIVS